MGADVISFELSGGAFDEIAQAAAAHSAAAVEALARGHRVEIAGKPLLRVTCSRDVAVELAGWFKHAARSSWNPGGWERSLGFAALAQVINVALADVS